MAERTAAEVLAEKLKGAWNSTVMNGLTAPEYLERIAACIAEDPAITVRTDLVVERVVVEFHFNPYEDGDNQHDPEHVRRILTCSDWYVEDHTHRIVVRPYPEATDA